jgi:peptidoglycan biosynthesis protein MviN/MurJ (putative lipid II flippase)
MPLFPVRQTFAETAFNSAGIPQYTSSTSTDNTIFQ